MMITALKQKEKMNNGERKMSFIKKEDLIEEIQSYGLPYDYISIHKIIEIINKQLVYTIGKGDTK